MKRECLHYPTQSHINYCVEVNCSPELAAFKGIARRGAWLVSPDCALAGCGGVWLMWLMCSVSLLASFCFVSFSLSKTCSTLARCRQNRMSKPLWACPIGHQSSDVVMSLVSWCVLAWLRLRVGRQTGANWWWSCWCDWWAFPELIVPSYAK